MTNLKEFYKSCENILGEEVKTGANITKRSCVVNNFKCDFYFIKGKLSKAECNDGKQLIEIYNNKII